MAEQAEDLVLASLATRTANYTQEFAWLDAKALMTIRVPNAPAASPTITPSLEAYDPASSEWFTIFTAAASQSPTGTSSRYTYVLTDTAFLPSGFTESKQVYLHPKMRLKITHADADAVDYTVMFLRVNSNNLGI